MTKIYSLLVFIRSRTLPFHFTVNKNDYDRLSTILDNASKPVGPGFFWCETTDGRSAIVNLHVVQTIRFLWDSLPLSDAPRTYGAVQMYLRGREEPIDVDTDIDSACSIYDFFTQLELDPTMSPFPSFVDSDGEYLYVNASEIDLVIAPKELMNEGARIAREGAQEGISRSTVD